MTHWPFIIRDCVLIKPGKYKTFTSLSSLAETLVKEGVVPYKIKRNPIFLKIIANQIVLSLMQDAQIGEIFFQKDNQSKEMSMHNLRCGFVPKDGQTEEISMHSLRCKTYQLVEQLHEETGISLEHYRTLNDTLKKSLES